MTAGNDNIDGNKYDDEIFGSTGGDKISGNGGNDYLGGESGNDTLVGGAGNDWLLGGYGYDTFVFDTKPGSKNVDYILDFDFTYDMLNLSKKAFSAYKTSGVDLTDDFVSGYGAYALDKSDHFIYDKNDGSLYYDADGSGKKAAVLIAVLYGTPTLSANDLEII